MFIRATAKSNAAVKASFIVAEQTASSTKSFWEGAFLKQCMLKVCEQVCPDQIQTFINLSLSIVTELAEDLKTQLAKVACSYLAFSLANSTDNTDTAACTFIRGVKSELSVMEKLLNSAAMHGTTTGKNMFDAVGEVGGTDRWCTCNV